MKGQETTSSMIFVIGILVLVATMIALGYLGLERINLPSDTKQAAEGDAETVARHLASLADRCWQQSRSGSAEATIACFQVTVEPSGRLGKALVQDRLEQLPKANLVMEPVEADTQTTVKITWEPGPGTVRIQRFQVCDPGRGDACELTKCTCDTACIPPDKRPYDPDTDGTADTDEYHCIETEHFHATEEGEPCTFNFECKERLTCVDEGGTRTCQ